MTSNSGRNGDSDNGRARQPAGTMIGVGIAIGTGLGVALGVTFDNLALGIATGSAIGVAIGAVLERTRGGTLGETHGLGRREAWVLVGLGLLLFLGLVAIAVLLALS